MRAGVCIHKLRKWKSQIERREWGSRIYTLAHIHTRTLACQLASSRISLVRCSAQEHSSIGLFFIFVYFIFISLRLCVVDPLFVWCVHHSNRLRVYVRQQEPDIVCSMQYVFRKLNGKRSAFLEIFVRFLRFCSSDELQRTKTIWILLNDAFLQYGHDTFRSQ